MKKITLFFALCLIVFSNLIAQARRDTLLTNFESTATTGFIYSTSSANVTKQVVANPDKSGENLSENVLQITANSSYDKSWEGVYSKTALVLNIDAGSGYRYLHFKVKMDIAANMLWQLNKSGWKYSNQVVYTTPNVWQYCVVDLLALTDTWNILPGRYDKMNFVPSKYVGGPFTCYLDDVYLSNWSSHIINVTTGVNNTSFMDKNINISRIDANKVKVSINSESTGNLKLDVFNIQGQLLQTHCNGTTPTSSYELTAPKNNLYILRVTDANGICSIKF